MSTPRPFVLSIAGFDPSAGAGVLADIKTIEMHAAYGLGVCTAITFQHENTFEGLQWVPLASIQKQLKVLLGKYRIDVIKIGLIENFANLNAIVDAISEYNPNAKIIWDPVLKASTGFEFHQHVNQSLLPEILKKLLLITPNLFEAQQLGLGQKDAIASGQKLSQYCNVYLTGGHRNNDADDFLFSKFSMHKIKGDKIMNGEKHGSGCVLSAAIASNLANGVPLKESCEAAKNYMNIFLKSNGLLGYHSHVPFIYDKIQTFQ